MKPSDHPLIEPAGQTLGSVGDRILSVPRRIGGFRFLAFLGIALLLAMLGLTALAWVLIQGVGVWGVGVPVAWGFAIINFVWWIGFGHAGTLISAILLLLHQRWRNSINRTAEAMTLFAVACAGLFPLLHLGRPHLFYYILPYPDTLGIWPNWRSPLVYDIIAVTTYGLVSLVFWYIGLIPDLASARDRTKSSRIRWLTGILSLGWTGSARHWHHHQTLYLLLAGLATPLVVSVHSIVALDFATGIVPGWHSTVFPPYFVAGAIFQGFALVLIIVIPLRRFLHFEDLITPRHLDLMAKVMLTSGLIVFYGYLSETFFAWYSADQYEWAHIVHRMFGPYWPVFWITIACNVFIANLLWLKRIRASTTALLLISIAISVGMWTERYMIVVVSLHADYLPGSWGPYHGTFWDWALLFGTIGIFTVLMLAFLRFVPPLTIYEIREMIEPEPEDPEAEQASVAPGYGLLADFDKPDQLLKAVKAAREAGYRQIETYTPHAVDGVAEELGLGRSKVALCVLVGALTGAGLAWFLQYYAAVIDYPWNIGGRPNNSWPSFIPIIFEVTVLFGALSGLFGMLLLCRMPKPWWPIFRSPAYRGATRDRFLLCVRANDPGFRAEETRQFLEGLAPRRVVGVPAEGGS